MCCVECIDKRECAGPCAGDTNRSFFLYKYLVCQADTLRTAAWMHAGVRPYSGQQSDPRYTLSDTPGRAGWSGAGEK
jgi:hypothetical protein